MTAPSHSAAKRETLREFMARGFWYPSSVLRRVGGDRFASRLHELRTLGIVDYECRRVPGGADNAYEYRLRVDLPPPEPKKRRITLRKRLLLAEAEVTRLRAENEVLRRSLGASRTPGVWVVA